MPGKNCCSVVSCRNNAYRAKVEGKMLSFFSFPHDPEMRKIWLKKCNRENDWPADNKRVCSEHFEMNDFKDKLKAELLGQRPRQLKKTAVPSLHLQDTEKCQTISEKDDTIPPHSKKVLKKLIRKGLTHQSLLKSKLDTFKKRFELLLKENRDLRVKNSKMQRKLKDLERKLKSNSDGFEDKVVVVLCVDKNEDE